AHSSHEKGRAPLHRIGVAENRVVSQSVLRATKNPAALISNQLNTKSLGQAAPSGGRELQRAGVTHADEPSAFEAAATNLGADMARDVIAPLAPVETRPAIDSAVLRLRHERGTQALKEPGAGVGQLAAIVGQIHKRRGLQGIGDGDANRARDVVVAGPREA